MYLSSEGNLLTILQTGGTCCAVRVVEHDSDTSLGDTSLSALVNQVLLVLGAHLRCVGFVPLCQCVFQSVMPRSRTCCMLVIPRTKHIASRILDFPDPLRPVMALNEASHPVMVVRTGYDLNPE